MKIENTGRMQVFLRNIKAAISTEKVGLGRELILVGIGQGLTAVVSVFGVRLLTQVLNPSTYGKLSLALTFVMLSQQLYIGPFANAVARFYSVEKEKKELPAFFYAVNQLLVKSTGLIFLIGLILLLVAIVIKQYEYVPLIISSCFYTLFYGWNTILDQLQNAARQRIVVVWHQALGQILKYSLAFLFATAFIASSYAAMSGYAVSSALILTSQGIFYLKLLRKSTKENVILRPNIAVAQVNKSFSNYASPFILWGLFTWIQMSSDRWALQTFTSTDMVGYYTVLYQLGYYPISLLTTVIVQFLSPILFERIGDGSDLTRMLRTQKNTQIITILAFGLTIILSLFFLLLHNPIFRLLTDSAYWHISYYLPFMVLSGGLFATGQISAQVLLNSQKPRLLFAPKVVTAVFGTLLNFVFGYFAGLSGVVISGVIFSVVFLGWIYILAQKETNFLTHNLKELNIHDIK